MDSCQPRTPSQADDPAGARPARDTPAEQRDRLRLLIIEDDRDQFELMRETLEDHFGKDVVSWAASKRQALEADPAAFSLILCDYNLPDGSGLDVLEAVVRRCRTPVLMVTGENIGEIAADAVRRGASDYVVKVGEYLFTLPLVVEKNLIMAKIQRENESLRIELERALAALREKNRQLQESLARVQELAATDPLTGLYNRRHFSQLFDQLFAEAQRYDKDLSCVMIDLDGYKQVNDTYGHQVGDQLLVLAGRVIKANLRRMDVAARYGGDEFVLLLPHATASEAAEVIRRIREEYLSASALLLKRNAGVGMSGGVASLANQRPSHSDQLVAMADAALYRAKEEGRNRTHLASGAVPRAAEAPPAFVPASPQPAQATLRPRQLVPRALSFIMSACSGEVQEWLNWQHWKCGEKLRQRPDFA